MNSSPARSAGCAIRLRRSTSWSAVSPRLQFSRRYAECAFDALHKCKVRRAGEPGVDSQPGIMIGQDLYATSKRQLSRKELLAHGLR